VIEYYDVIANKDLSEIYFSSLIPPRYTDYIYAIDIAYVLHKTWEGKVKLVYIGGRDYKMPKGSWGVTEVITPRLMLNASIPCRTYNQKMDAQREAWNKIYDSPAYEVYRNLFKQLKDFAL
jgi:hypothetical protein